MSKQTAGNVAPVEYNTDSASNPENILPEEESIPNIAAQSETEAASKTLQLLKEWEVVSLMIKTGQVAYKTVKGSSRIAGAGLDATEKAVTTLTGYSENIIQKVKPVLQPLDNITSEGLERFRKSFPIVKESSEKIYAGVVERLGNVVTPAVNTAVAMTEVGREQMKKVVRNITKSS